MNSNKQEKKLKIAVVALAIALMFTISLLIYKNNLLDSKAMGSKYRLEIESVYGDIEAYHPKVLAFDEKWNGYKYWMSYSPYPKGDDSKENPCIAVSNDLINWETPEGLENPLDERVDDGVKEQYNSDPHIIYNYDKNELECWWRYVDDINNKVIVYKRKTTDGINWTDMEIAISSDNRKEKDFVSPAIIYEDSTYKMWYVDQGNIVKYTTSKDGSNWEEDKIVEIEYEETVKTWHLDVISTEKGYEMIAVAFDKWANHNDMNLYYTSSENGINWDIAKVILEPSVNTKRWDNKGIYRSTFIYENGMYYVFYGGTSTNFHHGIGLIYGKNIFNLEPVETNFRNKKQVEELKKELNLE